MRFYTQHTAAVSALALHPDGGTVASASVEPEPVVRVWDSGSMHELAVLSGAHSAGVAALAFSGADGELLASVDMAHAPLLVLWDWRRGTLVASARVGRQRVLGVAFAPNGGALVTFARRQVRFWSLDGGRLTSRRALGGEGSAHTVLCCAFLPDGKTMLAGTATGELLLWQHGRCELVLRANRQQPIFAIHASNAGVFAAGRGGRLFCWLGVRSPPLRLCDALVIPLGSHLGGAADGAGRPLTLLRGEPPCVRSLSLRRGPGGGSGHGGRIRLCIVTRGGELWEMMLPATMAEAAGRLPPPALLVQGHSLAASEDATAGGALDEVAALATHPQDADSFATGGDDGTVRLWSVGARRMIGMRLLRTRVAALAFSSDGVHLAAAAGASLAILFADSLVDAAAAVLDSTGDVTCLAFSPDDELLAAGTAHGDVHLLRPNQA
jgi:WD40 repeat protein